ncbi:calcitonin gene-related peptide type 1 receptor-like isoform X2 [Tachypleus tridentatus]|uniref:calcitonin gene-related peptide type 1 receptor-like isoform X2 n=1 Tax=Tachypleus tridentatus TaxID=6853 RepID=UPI003FD50721
MTTLSWECNKVVCEIVTEQTNDDLSSVTDAKDFLLAQLKESYFCHQKALSSESNKGDLKCPIAFDGWGCWEATPPGNVAVISCPSFVPEIDVNEVATRKCGENGDWTPDEALGIKVANYSLCFNGSSFLRKIEQISNQDLLEDLLNLLLALPLLPYENTNTELTFSQCVRDVLSSPKPDSGELYCPRTFDGWSCWNDTEAGLVARAPCPHFIPGFNPNRQAYKVCEEDGQWLRHPVTNMTWSNYTTCIDYEDFAFRQRINTLYLVGYSISLVALVVALIIFSYFRALKCTRTIIHKHLFLSFILSNLLWVVWYTAVAQRPVVASKNKMTCRTIHVLVHNLLVCNYMWMFCEGLYLHTVLAVAFLAEDRLVNWFFGIGWGFPVLLTVLYTSLRTSADDGTDHCWLEDSVYIWIFNGPVCVSLLVNVLFLVNIVRVLLKKLNTTNTGHGRSGQTKKAVRAILILIPLLGLHYLLLPFRPSRGTLAEKVYDVISALFTSFQGLCVALLFCFCNNEVLTVVNRKWSDVRLMSRRKKTSSYAVTSMSYFPRSSPSDVGSQFVLSEPFFRISRV